MSKKIILIISILTLLILGCNTSSSTKTKNAVNVRVGFNGLAMEFMKNTPPAKVFEGETFPVIIKIRNNGAYSISKEEKAILSLGVEKDYTKDIKLLESGRIKKVEGTDKPIENAAAFNLEGRSVINLKGEEEVVSYNMMAGKVDPQSETHLSTVVATLCYPYQTVLETSVCIDPDVSNLMPGKKACIVQDLVFNDGQGAPVAVTKIEVSMLHVLSEQDKNKIRPQFLIFIENKGTGTVIKKNAVKEFCTISDTSHEKLNVVNVQASLSGKQLDCRKNRNDKIEDTSVKLKDKKELIRCTLDIENPNDAYTSPLKIKLDYGYTNSISANYAIQKIVR